MRRSSSVTLTEEEQNCAEQLARFFPDTVAVRVPIQVTTLRAGSHLRETTVIEFAGPEHAIFVSTMPLEFDDRVELTRDGKDSKAEAAVTAVQYHEGRKAVAVRFLQGHCDWVRQP